MSKNKMRKIDCNSKKMEQQCGTFVAQNSEDKKQNCFIITSKHKQEIPRVDLSNTPISKQALGLIPLAVAKRHQLVPIEIKDGVLYIAMKDPRNFVAIDDVKMISKLQVFPMFASEESISNTINQLYGIESAEKAVQDYKRENSINDVIRDFDYGLINEVDSAPIVRLVNSLLEEAVAKRASDIHIEPMDDTLRVRFRIDGQLQTVLATPKDIHSSVLVRIKIMGGMNIAEKRLPQDGRYETSVNGRNIDIRICIMPTIHGEKAVLRILDRENFLFSKGNLGFSEENMQSFNRLTRIPYGMVLVTGPTGSGKSTTLYTMLNEINNEYDNIITVEDPVEYNLPGLNQVQVNPEIGLTFANALRSILRQDPDVIMIGEIRDSDTAKLATRAAITGHLVLSTIHTNDAISTVARLVDMGVEPYILADALAGVISQRLVRKICMHCKQPYTPKRSEIKGAGIDIDYEGPFFKGSGCSACNHTGYLGRTAVHEVLLINKAYREMISNMVPIEHIKDYSYNHGMTSLKDQCMKLVKDGTTTLEEIVKLSYSNEE